MADVVMDSRRRVAETHYFLFEGSSTERLPGEVRRRLPKGFSETYWRDDGRRGALFVRRLKERGGRLAALRGAVRQAAESMKQRGARTARFVFPAEADALAVALLPHLHLADYSFDRYRKVRRAPRLTIHAAFAAARPSRSQVETAAAVAKAAAWARDLGNTPANHLGSRELRAEVARVARREGLAFRALSPAEIRREGMGGVLGVSSGSSRPPGFLILEHRPRNPRGRAVLVGKGVTFDSGGISIKSAASMGEMKFDMMGAATCLAIVRAAHALKIPARIVALAPLAENVPSGSSYRPGDILRMRNGKTVEVDNTDAEGRLILADALSYAEKFTPDFIVDFATLTGAVLVALGQECAGLLTDDEALAAGLHEAGEKTGDRFWRLPLWAEYRELIRSEYADMKNSGGRYGGTVSAAAFLREFVPEGIPWAHCDIAGVAHFEKARAGYPVGATGFGIAPAIDYLQNRYARRRKA
jgi:leucyl aminopeptidase